MKLRYLIPFIALLATGCNNASSSSDNFIGDNSLGDIAYTDIDPLFKLRITDSIFSNKHEGKDIGRVLNIKSTYSLFLDSSNSKSFPSPDDCYFEYDKNYLEITDCVMDNHRSYPHFVWHLKPIQITESTSIKVFYLDKLYSSYDISIKDLSINPSTCASISKTLNSASELFPDEITIFRDLSTYKNYFASHQYFNYIKNQPTSETFNNYEYALIRVFGGALGNERELNDTFILADTLYFDISSTRSYFEQAPDVTMTTVQNHFLCLVRYPSGLNVNNYDIWLSSIYEA